MAEAAGEEHGVGAGGEGVDLRFCVVRPDFIPHALEEAQQAGKTRYIGYSGDSEAARYAVETGRFDTLMTSISICDQEAIELTLPKAKKAKRHTIKVD